MKWVRMYVLDPGTVYLLETDLKLYGELVAQLAERRLRTCVVLNAPGSSPDPTYNSL